MPSEDPVPGGRSPGAQVPAVPTVEILDEGTGVSPGPGPTRRPSVRLAARLPAWLGARIGARRRALVVAGVVAGACTVAGVGIAAVRSMPQQPLPVLAASPPDTMTGIERPWEAGGDGRPSAPAVLAGVVRVQRPTASGPGAAPATVEARMLGVTGPGVVRNDSPPAPVAAGAEPIAVRVHAVLDCEQVPDVVPAGAYRLLLDAGRPGAADRDRRRGSADAAQAGETWGRAVQAACSTWRARTALTVTAASAAVDPVRPRVRLALTVTNSGRRGATVHRLPDDLPGDPSGDPLEAEGRGLPVEVPAGGTATVALDVVAADCSSLAGSGVVSDEAAWIRRGTGVFGVVGRSGPLPVTGDLFDAVDPELNGTVLGPAARRVLREAFDRVCGHLGAVPLAADPRGVRVDERSRAVDVPVLMTVPAGAVRSVQLLPVQDDPVSPPLWTATPQHVPDAAGTVRAVLRYRLDGAGTCDPGGPGGLTFTVRAVLRVPDGGAVREVPSRHLVDLAAQQDVRQRLCLRVGAR